MWFLVWINFITSTGKVNHYQISTHGSEELCQVEKQKAEVIITQANEAVVCLWAQR